MTNAPGRVPRIRPFATRVRRWYRQCTRDAAYLLLSLPTAVASTVALVILLVSSASTLIVWIGVPIAVGTMWVARGFASLERVRLRWVDGRTRRGSYAVAAQDSAARPRLLSVLRVPQSWRDLLHGLVVIVPTMITWTLAVTWLSVALTGLTAWLWEGWLPEDSAAAETSVWLAWTATAPGQVAVGVVFAGTMPALFRGLTTLHVMLGDLLLDTVDSDALIERVGSLERARTKAASAEATALRRLERDLHDGPQQRLVRLGMEIAAAQRALDSRPAKTAQARTLLATAGDLTAEALTELRALTRGIAPPLLAERGLRAAIESLADRSTVPVAVTWKGPKDLPLRAETGAYFAVAEALANVAKHSRATAATVAVNAEQRVLRVTVTDDGVGGAHPAKGQGLGGLAERIEGAGGSLAVADAPSGGTVVEVLLPLD